jgi:Domain of unknown function (DUF4160)
MATVPSRLLRCGRVAPALPTVCEFDGISVSMYYRDHLPPHVHVFHGGREAVIDIRTCRLMAGGLSGGTLTKVRAWVRLRRQEFEANWVRARLWLLLVRVAPLP